MSIIVRPVPDLRKIAMAWARETFPGQLGTAGGVLRVRTETPTDLRDILGTDGLFLRVGQIPGRTTRNEITAPLDFDVYGMSDAAAGDLSREIDAELQRQRWIRTSDGASLQIVTNQMSPAMAPWADAAVRRYYSSYLVTARR